MLKIMINTLICLILTFIVSKKGVVMAEIPPNLDISLALDKISYVMDGHTDSDNIVDRNDAIKIIITLENTGTESIITEEGFSNQDFRKILNFMVMGDGGTVTALITANGFEGGSAPPPEITPVVVGGKVQLVEVVPVEVIPPGWKKEVSIPNARISTLYTLPAGYLCVKAVISMSTYPEIFKTEGGVDYAELGNFEFAGLRESALVCFFLNGDEDGDRYYFPLPFGVNTVADCNDNDFDVNPGNEEIVGNGIDDDCNQLTSDDEPVVCITDLSARARSGEVELVWTHVTETDYYEILRKDNPSGPFSVIDTTTSIYSVYIDNTVNNGTTYYYYVRGVRDNGSSRCDSNEVSATPVQRTRRR